MKKILPVTTALLALLALTAGLTAQTTIQVDFGISTQPTADVGWNNAGAAAPGGGLPGPIADLLDSAGALSGIGMTTTKSGTAGTSGSGANYAGPYPAAIASMPSSALQDGLFFAQGGGTITLSLTGLNAGSTYDFIFYGARGNNGLKETVFTVTGNNSDSGSILNGVLDNATEVVEITGISPTGSGELTVDCTSVGGVSNNGGSLNLMVMSEMIPLDTDLDGMPDQYEDDNGLNKNFAGDADQGADDGLFDNDGLTNLEEYNGTGIADFNGGTDPNNPDWDGDGLTDGEEVKGLLNPWSEGLAGSLPGESTDPFDEDSDGDTLLDGVELSNANGSITDPNWDDSDLDNLPDAWEIANSLDPTDPLGDHGDLGDPDMDNLDNAGEYFEGTDPHNWDCDGDTLKDGDEVDGTLNPWNGGVLGTPAGDRTEPLVADSDSDGLDDFEEIDPANGSVTDPNNKYTDADNLLDGFEVDNNLDPTDASGENGDAGNPDGDTLSNLEEQTYGSNPRSGDTDGDNLEDGAEVHTHGTDPTLADSDGDLIDDDVELAGTTDPTTGDSDLDGHKDAIEIEAGSLPDDIASVPAFPSIAWSVQEFNTASALSTEGTLLYAENFNGDDATVNGILFTGRSSDLDEKSSPLVQTLLVNSANVDLYDDEVPELAPLLESFWWTSAPTGTQVGLTGLTPGKTYLVQFGRADDRSEVGIAGRYAFADGLGGDTDTDPVGPTNTIYGGPDNPALLFSGTFTATSTVQGFATGQYLATGAFSGSAMAFLQVREIEPVADIIVTDVRRIGTTLEVDFAGLDPAKSYQLVRSANLQDGFPTVVDGPRIPAGATATFKDLGASANEAFYQLEETP